MRPEELFNLIKKTKFEKVGDDVDFAVLVFPEEKIVRLIFEESASKRDWQNNFKNSNLNVDVEVIIRRIGEESYHE